MSVSLWQKWFVLEKRCFYEHSFRSAGMYAQVYVFICAYMCILYYICIYFDYHYYDYDYHYHYCYYYIILYCRYCYYCYYYILLSLFYWTLHSIGKINNGIRNINSHPRKTLHSIGKIKKGIRKRSETRKLRVLHTLLWDQKRKVLAAEDGDDDVDDEEDEDEHDHDDDDDDDDQWWLI